LYSSLKGLLDLQEVSENAFELLVKPIRRLIEQRGFSKPTEPQQRTIPPILEGKNVLLISPTATGKTEAAFLPVLSMLLQEPKTPVLKHFTLLPCVL
jgi:ATP-dependent Lhr-like helicase